MGGNRESKQTRQHEECFGKGIQIVQEISQRGSNAPFGGIGGKRGKGQRTSSQQLKNQEEREQEALPAAGAAHAKASTSRNMKLAGKKRPETPPGGRS